MRDLHDNSQRRDWLVGEPVQIEPVSSYTSLLTGKFTGYFADLALLVCRKLELRAELSLFRDASLRIEAGNYFCARGNFAFGSASSCLSGSALILFEAERSLHEQLFCEILYYRQFSRAYHVYQIFRICH